MCVCLAVCAQRSVNELNANSSKTVKVTDLKFDKLVPRDSPDMTSKNFSKRERGQSYVAPNFFDVKC